MSAGSSAALQRLVAWLAGLPARTVLVWGDVHATHGGAHTGWVDVSLAHPDASALKLNWVWTVSDGSHEDDDDPLVVVAAHDVSVWQVSESGSFELLDDPVAVTPLDGLPSADEIVALDTALAVPGRELIVRGGWSESALNGALTHWCAVHAGRDDLSFRFDRSFDPCPALPAQLAAASDEVLSGNGYLLAPGLVASSSVFDVLLALDADEAASLTAKMSRLAEKVTAHDV